MMYVELMVLMNAMVLLPFKIVIVSLNLVFDMVFYIHLIMSKFQSGLLIIASICELKT